MEILLKNKVCLSARCEKELNKSSARAKGYRESAAMLGWVTAGVSLLHPPPHLGSRLPWNPHRELTVIFNSYHREMSLSPTLAQSSLSTDLICPLSILSELFTSFRLFFSFFFLWQALDSSWVSGLKYVSHCNVLIHFLWRQYWWPVSESQVYNHALVLISYFIH